MKNAVRFKIYNATELTILEQTIKDAAGKWAADWLGEVVVKVKALNTYDNVEFSRNFGEAGTSQKTVHRTVDRLALATETKSVLLAAMLGLDWADPQAVDCKATQRLLSTGLEALAEQLLNAEKASELLCFESEPWKSKGGGWLGAQIDFNGTSIYTLLSPAEVQTHLPGLAAANKASALVGRGKDAIVEHQVKLRAELGTVNLSLGDFHSLKKGDVLRLNTHFVDRVKIKTQGGTPICHGALGKSANRRAIKIVDK